MSDQRGPIAIAITGASGMPYALRLLDCLVRAKRQLFVLYSQAAQVVMRMEAAEEMPGRPQDAQAWLTGQLNAAPGQIRVFGRQEWTAPVASGSNPPESLVVCPCTTGTLATIATGVCQDLIDRAADVMLKEQRKVVLVVRETPLSAIHLEHMLKLARMGAVIMPANPGFYFGPRSVDDLVDFMVARILDHIGVEQTLTPRWGAD